LDFVELTKTKDWWDELSENNIVSIQKGLDDLENGRVHTDEEVREGVSQRIIKAKMG
jgi:predicted transcriptional regulator